LTLLTARGGTSLELGRLASPPLRPTFSTPPDGLVELATVVVIAVVGL
jgi:hypothetical protein